jgi:hypothetical protein
LSRIDIPLEPIVFQVVIVREGIENRTPLQDIAVRFSFLAYEVVKIRIVEFLCQKLACKQANTESEESAHRLKFIVYKLTVIHGVSRRKHATSLVLQRMEGGGSRGSEEAEEARK